MSRRGFAIVAVAAGIVVPLARTQVVRGPSLLRTVRLRPNAVTTFTLRCPAGTLAVSGGVYTPARRTALLGVEPLPGGGAFLFRLGNPPGNGVRRATAAVACRSVRAGGASTLKLSAVKVGPVLLPPQTQKRFGLRCPGGTIPAGAGLDLQPTRGSSRTEFASSPLSLRQSTTTLRGFTFAVRNTASTARRATFYGNCATVVRAAGAPVESLHVVLTTYRVSSAPGEHKLVRSCRPGWMSLAAGFRLRSAGVSAEGATAVASGGRWWLSSSHAGPVASELQLTCARVTRG